MAAAVVAWVIALAVVALIVAGLIAGRRRRRRDSVSAAGLFSAHTEDERLAELTELQRGQLQALHNSQQLGPH